MNLNHPVKNERLQTQSQGFRLSLLAALLIVLSMALILRLGHLQFLQYKRYATLSLKNQMSIIPIAPTRGIIVDRNGEILADNIPVYALEIIPEHVKNIKKTLLQLKELIPSITDEDIENFQHALTQNRSYLPIPFKLKLSQEEVAIFASNQHLFPGVSIKARLMRYYPFGDAAAHLLGYVGRINVKELQTVNNINYRATNFIGKTGIERFYESNLHGNVGYQQVETDVSGRVLRTISKQPPVSGSRLQLTLDIRLQQVAMKALRNNRGAAVVMNVKQGDVLAMASTPSFDPNHFVNGISQRKYQKLSNAKDKPLYNRAVRGLYPPASTIKPFIALAGLNKELITPNTRIYDPGWFRLAGISHKYRDWKRAGHGFVSLKKAITVSCDTYFYQLGNQLGITAIEDMLNQFGFGQLSHIDLFEEAAGIVPSASWKKRTKGISWYPGDTIITAIGQGFMLASPLQLANATASLSMHGQRFRPHLLNTLTSDDGQTQAFQPLEEYPLRLKDENNWSLVIDAMKNVITSRQGTGHRFGRNTSYTVAAKTGTAQVFSGNQYEKKKYLDIPEALRDHSLFIAFAPVDKPEIAVAVLVENDFTAPNVARKIMDSYFKQAHNKKAHEHS